MSGRPRRQRRRAGGACSLDLDGGKMKFQNGRKYCSFIVYLFRHIIKPFIFRTISWLINYFFTRVRSNLSWRSGSARVRISNFVQICFNFWWICSKFDRDDRIWFDFESLVERRERLSREMNLMWPTIDLPQRIQSTTRLKSYKPEEWNEFAMQSSQSRNINYMNLIHIKNYT